MLRDGEREKWRGNGRYQGGERGMRETRNRRKGDREKSKEEMTRRRRKRRGKETRQ